MFQRNSQKLFLLRLFVLVIGVSVSMGCAEGGTPNIDLAEDFSGVELGKLPAGWHVDVPARPVPFVSNEQAASGETSLKAFRDDDNHLGSYVGPKFTAVDTGMLRVSFKVLVTDANGRSGMVRIGHNGAMLVWRDGMITSYGRNSLTDESSTFLDLDFFPTDQWQEVTVDLYLESQNYDVYVEGQKITETPRFYSQTTTTAIDKVELRLQSNGASSMVGPVYYDDLKVIYPVEEQEAEKEG